MKAASLCADYIYIMWARVSLFSPHQGWAYSRQSWASSLRCGWRSSGPPSLRTPPAGWGSWHWPTGSFWDYERPTLESERAEQRSVSALVSTISLSLNSFRKALIQHILWYLNGSSLQNRFDSLRNYKDIGLSLRRWVGKVGLIRLPIVGQLRVSERSPSGDTDVRMSHAVAFLFSITGQSC